MIRRQIQEILHIEKIFDEAGIKQEIDAYAALVPDSGNWKATMLIEYPDPHERKRELARLIGVEDRLFVEVEGGGGSTPSPTKTWTAKTLRRPRRCTSCASSCHTLRVRQCGLGPLSSWAATTGITRHMSACRLKPWPAWRVICADGRAAQAGLDAAAALRLNHHRLSVL